MIYKPMEWKNIRIGSYYLRQTQFSKIVPNHKEAQGMYEISDISVPMKVLDQLGQVQWRINKLVLDVIFC
jgi:DNA-directed RNA polymerase